MTENGCFITEKNEEGLVWMEPSVNCEHFRVCITVKLETSQSSKRRPSVSVGGEFSLPRFLFLRAKMGIRFLRVRTSMSEFTFSLEVDRRIPGYSCRLNGEPAKKGFGLELPFSVLRDHGINDTRERWRGIPNHKPSIPMYLCFEFKNCVGTISVNSFEDLSLLNTPFNENTNESIDLLRQEGWYNDFLQMIENNDSSPEHILKTAITESLNYVRNDIQAVSIEGMTIPASLLLLVMRSEYFTKVMIFHGQDFRRIIEKREIPINLEYEILKKYVHFIRHGVIEREGTNLIHLVKLYHYGHLTDHKKLMETVNSHYFNLQEIKVFEMEEIIYAVGPLLYGNDKLTKIFTNVFQRFCSKDQDLINPLTIRKMIRKSKTDHDVLEMKKIMEYRFEEMEEKMFERMNVVEERQTKILEMLTRKVVILEQKVENMKKKE